MKRQQQQHYALLHFSFCVWILTVLTETLTGAIFLSQSQNAAYRTPQCSQSLENNATESLSLNSAPSRSQYGGRLFPLATLHLQNHRCNLNKHLETSFK